MNNGKFFAGLALGALVGSALTCFAHSNRGRKLRRDVYGERENARSSQ